MEVAAAVVEAEVEAAEEVPAVEQVPEPPAVAWPGRLPTSCCTRSDR